MKNKTQFYSGMLGGGIVIALFLIILLTLSFFNYRVSFERVYVNSTSLHDDICADSIYTYEQMLKCNLLEELNNDKVILTPQEYTNNVVSYYNSILLVMSVMLAAFSFLSFVYLKSHSNDLIQENLKSEEFIDNVSEILIGRAEDSFRELLGDINEKLLSLEGRLVEFNDKADENDINELE